MSGEGNLTASEYVKHHLTHLKFNVTSMTFDDKGGFYTLNVDTLFFSTLLLVGIGFFICKAASQATPGVPGRFQVFVEMVLDFINDSVKETFDGKSKLAAPLALTLALYIFLMNFMDLLPLDFLPWVASHLGVHYLRVVPTADVNTTFALSFTVFLLILYFNFTRKGILGVLKEFTTTPFTANNLIFKIILLPVNLVLKLIEEIVKPISLSLRLYGNLFAGELVFILIGLLPFYVLWVPNFLWTAFHILIISVQTYIFMMLTMVYLNMACHEH